MQMVNKCVIIFLALYLMAGMEAHAIEYGYNITEKTIINQCEAWFKSRNFDLKSMRFSKFAIREIPGGLCMDGPMEDSEAYMQLKSKTSHLSDASGFVIVVRSPGGMASSAMSIAEEISRIKSTVIAFDVCASACANYIMAAANRRIVHDRALLLFHGAPSYHDVEDILEFKVEDNYINITDSILLKSIRHKVEFLKKQKSFLQKSGIQPYIFSWMMLFDRMEESDKAKFCPKGTSVILYSPEILGNFNYNIHIYKGPDSQKNLDFIYPDRGAKHRICYWNSKFRV